jgi:hypothetical protein
MDGCFWKSLCLSPLLWVATALLQAKPEREVMMQVAMYPGDGALLKTHVPVLAWVLEGMEDDSFSVWMDGVKLVTLAPGVTVYATFPLSYGIHEWFVSWQRDGVPYRSATHRFQVVDAPLDALPAGAMLLREGWTVQSAAVETRTGDELSTGDGFLGYATSVPATVLSVLVRNSVYPNPYLAQNNLLIPDAHDGHNERHGLLKHSHLEERNPWADPYWFVREFELPQDWIGKTVVLALQELNYRAELWLNGHRIAGPEAVVGMERRFRFELEPEWLVEGVNRLAILVYGLDEVGEPDPEPAQALAYPGRNMGVDGRIALNYTKWDSVGWDWQPAIRDRNMGIIGDVVLYATDGLEMDDLYVAATLPTAAMDVAEVSIAFELKGAEHLPDLDGVMQLRLLDASAQVATWRGDLKPFLDGKRVRLCADDLGMLKIHQPRLWWPGNMGEPHLYRLEVEVGVNGQVMTAATDFGIRKVETAMGEHSRRFWINGRELFIRAGNWVMDMTLSSTADRYRREVELARHANLNLLRVWGPTGVPPTAFFEAADRAGMLVQQDFLSDYWGTDRNREDLVPPQELFEQASIDIVKKLCNHPSLVIWCGGNEGPNPREQWITEELLPVYDPLGGRYYLSASDGDGLQGGGPYHNLEPERYHGHPKIRAFNSEIGPSGIPVVESLERFLPNPPAAWVPGRFPLDRYWAYHNATNRPEDDRKFTHLDDVLRKRYGDVSGNDREAWVDYAAKAQLLNADTYQSVIDALNRQIGTTATGYSFWKFNSSWPSVVWQLFDWFEQPHAGFYAVRRGNMPLRVQYHPDDRSLGVVNLTGGAIEAANVHALLLAPWRACALEHHDPGPGGQRRSVGVRFPGAPSGRSQSVATGAGRRRANVPRTQHLPAGRHPTRSDHSSLIDGP